ncbi:MAG: hypothetical protein JO060_01750, partial [Candidatus Eremiobacteraeota bacterium]|nr:hypothetical protein [Candidatus Eremiobacteraeota bacterium]
MNTKRLALTFAMLSAAAVLVAGVRFSTPTAAQPPTLLHLTEPFALDTVAHPILITLGSNKQLTYWPISRKGSNHPRKLAAPSGLTNTGAMAANGQIVAITNSSPNEV